MTKWTTTQNSSSEFASQLSGICGLDQQLQSAIPFVKHAKPVEIYAKDGIIASIMTGDCGVMDIVKF